MPEVNFKENAIKHYHESELYQEDALKIAACHKAMKMLFKELGLVLNVDKEVMVIDDITINAVYAPAIPEYEPPTAGGVDLQAHVKCELCGEIRHSETFSVSEYEENDVRAAPYLGRFLATPHICEAKNESRRPGLRPE